MNKDELKHFAILFVSGLGVIGIVLICIFTVMFIPGCCSPGADGFLRCTRSGIVPRGTVDNIPNKVLNPIPSQSPTPTPVLAVDKPVCIVDTGVDYNHPFLKGKVKRAINYSSSRGNSIDVHGHGTHVAGLAVIAGAKNLLSCKALNNRGRGNCSQTAKCIDWCVDRDAGVVNLSLGRERPCKFTRDAIQRAVDKGIIVVTSAGNRGRKSGVCSYPGRLPTTINVGSGTRSKPDSFSSTKCDVFAYEPGRNRRSTLPRGRWGTKSGTSMSSSQCAAKKARGEKCGDEL